MTSTPQQQNPQHSQQLKRATCSRCRRPSSHCYCHLIRSVSNRTAVLIIQHPLEQKNAKGTARLLNLCLENSQLLVAEQFADAELKALLDQPYFNLLLYPSPNDDKHNISCLSPTLILKNPAQYNLEQKPLRLILLDGTWRKSRKLLHCNPRLAALPRLTLEQIPASRYHIRKAHKPEQLSTFEACAEALKEIETLNTSALLKSFDEFIETFISKTGD